MTPRVKRAMVNITAIIIAAGSVIGWVVRSGASAVDARYVKTEAFAAYQQGQANARSIDSLNYSRDMRELKASVSRVETTVVCLKPRNRLRPECQ